MVDVALAFPIDRQHALAKQIRSVAREHPEVSGRSVRKLRAALRAGRLAVAIADGCVVGWFLSENVAGAAHELGYLYVAPRYRDGSVFDRMLALLLALEPRAIAVTFRPAFAAWLCRSYGFEPATLGGVVALSRGTFLLRRLTPGRLAAVLRHTSAGAPLYLSWQRPSV